jgi:hypothetical protein
MHKKTITIQYKIGDKKQLEVALRLLPEVMAIYKKQIEENKKTNKLSITIE